MYRCGMRISVWQAQFEDFLARFWSFVKQNYQFGMAEEVLDHGVTLGWPCFEYGHAL